MAEKFVRVNVTLYRDMLKEVDSFAKKRHEDRSTAIRQLISAGLRERNKKEVVKAYRDNRITLREAAKLLSVDYWKVQDILAEEGIPISDLTESEVKSRMKKVKKDTF
ncbi:MAG TPA: ribbon-helix-helix protein, CopG family [Candidatus Altiarchaeales archaeon]|nr:ribbon-helix-helix protein, CopG family [Candidatus Altiarchaeales archaeon]